MLRIYLLTTVLFLGGIKFSSGQDWKVEHKPSSSFIENQGQFRSNNAEKIGGIDFAVDYGSTRIFFGKKGVSFDFMEATKKSREEREKIMAKEVSSIAEHKEKERLFGKFMYKFDDVSFNWENGSPEAEIIGINQKSDYHSYSFEDEQGEIISKNHIKGYEKIRYKNIYPGIDIEYTIHPQSGVKYALYLSSKANPNDIILAYDREINLIDGAIHIPSMFGDIIDHAPFTFYGNNKDEKIASAYKLKGKNVTFELSDYDNSREVTIDPWVQTPTFNTNWNCIWECEYDSAGNVYTIGGTMPMTLQKYDPTGVLLWTHNTPYDTTSWLGGFATNDAGTSYITQGSVNSIQRVDNNGNVVWTNNTGGGTIGDSDEYWNVQFNCDETKVIVGGTDGAFGLPPVLEAAIFEIDVANGNQLSSQVLAVGNALGFPPSIQEVRSLSASPDSKYYWLAHDTIGYINDNFDMCTNTAANTFKIDNDMGLGYKNENYRYNNTGIMAVRADENFLYVNRGDEVQKRDLQTLAIVATAPIPGGAFNNIALSGNQMENSGIDVDDCGNIFVGSTNQVVEYDNNLNQLNTFPTSFRVYDVHVAPNGRVIAGGSTGTAADNARDGYIQQFNVGSCAPLALICCDANFCNEGPFCEQDAPITIEVSQTGGTFSGNGVDPTTGVFDPSAAGVGTHTITYTLACGSESLDFIVDACATLTVCEESNGDLTVSGGVGPYEWAEEETVNTPITNQTECENCGFDWIGFGGFGNCLDGTNTVTNCTSVGWTNYANGTTVGAPTTFPIQVTDDQGSTIVINSAGDIAPCTTSPCTNLTVTITTQADVTCNGLNNGSATVEATGGNGNYTYTWNPGALNGATQNNLAPGSYTVDVVDSDGCDGTVLVEIVEPTALDVQLTATSAGCGVADGSATATVTGGTSGYTYSWSNGGTGATINNVSAGSYDVTVTDANNCTAQESITVQTSSGPTLTEVSSNDVSCFGASDGDAEVEATGGTTPYTYTWSPGNLNGAIQNGLSAGTYNVDVEDDDGCVTSISVDINQPDAIDLTVSSNPTSCTVDDGSATVNATGGSGGFSYDWSNGETTATINAVGAGNYSVTVTDASGCTADTNVNVNSVNGPELTLSNITDVSCVGDADGTATVSVDAGTGTGPFTYEWTPSGGTDPTATGLTTGTYNVTVTDDAGCIAVETVVIGAPSEIEVTGTVNPVDCGVANGTISVSASGGAGGYTYSWDAAVPYEASINDLLSDDYTVTVTDANGCTVNETFSVGQNNGIPVEINPQDPVITAGSSVELTATTNPFVANSTFNWSPADGLSCTDCAEPTAAPESTTTYIVNVTTPEGCIGQDTVTVFVESACDGAFLPTIFSPNADGLNDELCLISDCATSMELSIYNRWGERVFESTDVDFCWDGTHREKAVNTGVFVYKLRVFLSDGTEIFDSGNLTLVR